MPIDPDISLKVDPQGGQTAANPLGTLGQFANIQNSLNQNRLFQQTFNARIQAGQIMSAAPDIETGFNQMLKDPQVAPFAGEMINMYRQSQLAQVQMQGEQQNQAQSALTYAQKLALPSSLANPAALDPNLTAALRITSPGVQGRVLGAVNDIRTSLLADLPSNPSSWTPQQFQTYTQRVTAQSLATGTPIDVVHGVIGNPTIVNQGNVIQGGVQQAPQYGSGLAPSGSALPVGAPGGYQETPSGAKIPVPGVTGTGGTTGGGGVGNALVGGNTVGAASPNSGNSLLPVGASPPGGSPASGIGSTLPPIPLPPSGKPVSIPMQSPSLGTGVGGVPVLSKSQQAMADSLQQQFSGEGLKSYNSAAGSLASLKYMDADYDNMVKNGGFLVPGSAAEFRANLAKGVNTLAQITGAQPPFDTSKVTSIEDFQKESPRMALQVTNQFLGAQREAAETIGRIATSVPNINNTYMGGKLVINSLQASAQRVMDQRNFENAWQARNQGNLTGAAEAFNSSYPAEDYANQVLNKFGLNEKGFNTPEAARDAYKMGYITPTQLGTILHSQFPGQFTNLPGQQ